MNTIDEIIKFLNLKPHPEGGFYKETYRSLGEINEDNLGVNYRGKRHYSTCIYFMLTSNSFSAFHKINQDEIWHFYNGSPIILHTISPNGKHQEYSIGSDISKGEVPQVIVPGGYWFAATVINQNSYALVGCTVAPGFDFEDFVLASREELVKQFPKHKSLIESYTRA